jgi:hypothetical protein
MFRKGEVALAIYVFAVVGGFHDLVQRSRWPL